eukprot:g25234.t1
MAAALDLALRHTPDNAFKMHETPYTVDAFHRGRFYLAQPKDTGHRSGIDAMLLASLVAAEKPVSVADLGAGAGAAGLAVAARLESARVLLVEKSPVMAAFARQTVSLEQNAYLKDRVQVLEADVALTGRARLAAGLEDDVHDHVIMNPPFNLAGDRRTPDGLKAQAHAMTEGLFESWIRTAGAIMKPGGQLSLIARPQSVGEILLACGKRFGGIEITPVHPRPDENATRILVTAIKGSRARLSLRAPLWVHGAGGHGFSQVVDDLNNGPIMTGGSQFKPALSLATAAPMLEKAFGKKEAPVVAISLNSPGGSPVQSRLIFQRIRSLAEEKQKKVLIFVEDVAASGGYMIALAGDEIFVDPSSIVGSIGVVSGGFGFPELLRKIGVERRIYTAGENKAILDPFQPEKEDDVEHLKALQLEIHKVFIDMVKMRRGERLANDGEIFSGLFWTGARGVELGLVDGLGDMRDVLKRRFGKDTRLELIGSARTVFGRRIPGVAAPGFGEIAAHASAGLAATIEERALWSRYGL